MCGGPRTTCRVQFCPSTMQVLESEFSLSVSAFTCCAILEAGNITSQGVLCVKSCRSESISTPGSRGVEVAFHDTEVLLHKCGYTDQTLPLQTRAAMPLLDNFYTPLLRVSTAFRSGLSSYSHGAWGQQAWGRHTETLPNFTFKLWSVEQCSGISRKFVRDAEAEASQ